jgi:hypothetical protein
VNNNNVSRNSIDLDNSSTVTASSTKNGIFTNDGKTIPLIDVSKLMADAQNILSKTTAKTHSGISASHSNTPSIFTVTSKNKTPGSPSTFKYELVIEHYSYKVIMKTQNNARFIVSERFVNNATSTTWIHILMVSNIHLEKDDITISYMINSATGLPYLIQPAEIQMIPDSATEKDKNIIQLQNYTSIPNETLEQITLLARELSSNSFSLMDVKQYRAPKNSEETAECLRLFDRPNLESIYTQFPEFLRKVASET